MSNKRNAASRRKELREQRRETIDEHRKLASDGVFGIELRTMRPGGGRSKLQVRWTIDPDDPFTGLMALARLRAATLVAVERDLVENARDAGLSWADIGFALGITAEGARLRYGGVA